jgi:hypothetical protein
LIIGRRVRLSVAILAIAVVGLAAPASGFSATRGSRVDIDSFMTGLACVESAGRYEARNRLSGALGKYQFMPRVWVAWSGRYLGNRWARPTARNQEYVARERIRDLRQRYGSWRLVALWWRTGNAPRDERRWSIGSVSYVRTVMAFARRAATPGLRRHVPARCYPRDFGAPQIRHEPWPRVAVSGRSVFLRRGAGSVHRPFEVVHRGDRLAVLGRAPDAHGNRWLKVGLKDGRHGWMFAAYADAIRRGSGTSRRGAGN